MFLAGIMRILLGHVVLREACPCLPPTTVFSSPMIFEKCGGKLAQEGRDTTP